MRDYSENYKIIDIIWWSCFENIKKYDTKLLVEKLLIMRATVCDKNEETSQLFFYHHGGLL